MNPLKSVRTVELVNKGLITLSQILTHPPQKHDCPTEAQTDLQNAIVLAQTKQSEDAIDRQNNFNLALYYLAAGRFEESDGLYSRLSEASRNSMVSDRPKVIEEAIRDLDDYLTLFPDRLQAREVCDRLSALV